MTIELKDYQTAVLEAFSFLITKYGYNALPESDFTVSFQRASVTINVMYDARRSHELDLRLSYFTSSDSADSFTLDDILHAENGGSCAPQVSSLPALLKALQKIADKFQKYGENYIQGDSFSFRRLSKDREKRSNEYAITTKASRVKAEAGSAWKNRDYLEVVSLLSSIHKHLSKSELMKLAYSKKKAEKL